MFYRDPKGNLRILEEHPDNEDALLFIKLWQEKPSSIDVKTSGSTGPPKHIKISRTQILASVSGSKKMFDWNQEDLFVCSLSLLSIAGKLMIIRALECRASILFVPAKADPTSALEPHGNLISTFENKLIFAMVPLQVKEALQRPENPWLSMAKNLLIGGASINTALEKTIKELSLNAFATYGMTETVTHVAIRTIKSKSEAYHVLPGVEIRQNKNECLELKAPQTLQKWISTRDRVKIVTPKSFHYLGRVDNIINSGGIKIQLEAVESKINEATESSFQFFAFATDDPRWGEALSIAFVPEKGSIKVFQKNFMQRVLTKFEIPKYYFPVDQLELTPSGKIDKKKTIDVHIKNKISD